LVPESRFGQTQALQPWHRCSGAAGHALLPFFCQFILRLCRRLYVPATKLGGGERLIWEARVAGVKFLGRLLGCHSTHQCLQIPSGHIDIEPDNDGLREFISGATSAPPLPRRNEEHSLISASLILISSLALFQALF
jgi:hypothetical protein